MLGISLRTVDGGTCILKFQSRNIAFKGFSRTKLIIDTVDHAIVFFFKRELIDTCIVVKLQHTNCVFNGTLVLRSTIYTVTINIVFRGVNNTNTKCSNVFS